MEDIVKKAHKSFETKKQYWHDIYDKAKDDLKFQSDEKHSQWDEGVAEARRQADLPVIQIDQLNQFVHQVSNDIRMNTPSINVIPATGADKETAEIYKGLIRNIEYKSNADNAYDMAVNNAIKCSLGFIRVDHDYENDDGLEQALFIKRVVNPLAVYLDDCIEPDGSDAMEGWVLETLSVAEFKKRYPKFTPVSFTDEGKECKGEDDEVVIAEYFYIEEQDRVITSINGEVTDYTEDMGEVPTRTVKKRVVHRCMLSGQDELEKTIFPGKYIPIVPVYGEEAWVDGKREIYSLIRKSKEAQRMHNLWQSLQADSLMKQTSAKWQAASGQIDDYKDDYLSPHKAAALRYEPYDDAGKPLPPPIPIAPPPSPMGYVEALVQSVDHIRSTLGIYGAGVGDRTNEVSGVAIDSRKLESDTATYHFGDNLIKSLTHVGRILVHAIPEIYDSERVIRIIDGEDKPQQIGVNGALGEEQEQTVDLRTGKFDVRVTTGTSYATKRQASAQFYENVIVRSPEMMNVVGDLMFENSDVEGAQAMAERMKKIIDPKLLEEGGDDPRLMMLQQQLEQSQMQLQQMSAQLEEKQTKNQTDVMKIQADLEKTRIEAQMEQQKLNLEREKLAYEQARLQVEQSGLALSQEIGTNVTI